MGEAIKELGWKRSDVVLSTKIFWVSTAECLHRCSCILAAQAAKPLSCTVLLQGPGGGPNDKGLSRKHIIEGTKVHDQSQWHDALRPCRNAKPHMNSIRWRTHLRRL